MSFGKRLLEIRKSKKLSQDGLAKQLGVHGAVIGRYERDEVKPSIDMATKIAEILKVSLDYLVGNRDLMLDISLVQKIEEIQKLKEEDKNQVFYLIDMALSYHKTKQAFSS